MMTEQQQQSVFDTWLRDYRALLYKVIRSYAFTQEDQEDLFQEITVQMWRSVPRFRGDSAVSTWLYRIALNTAMKWSQKERKHGGHQTLTHEQHLIEMHQTKDDRLDWLYEQIAKLDEVDRSLTLLMLDGFSYKEMAGIVGISETYVGVKINRIKKHLIEKSNDY